MADKIELIERLNKLLYDIGLTPQSVDIIIKDPKTLNTIPVEVLRRYASRYGFERQGPWGENAEIYADKFGYEIAIATRDDLTDKAECVWNFISKLPIIV